LRRIVKTAQVTGFRLRLNECNSGIRCAIPRYALHARASRPDIVAGPRIGLTKVVELPWRYGLKDSKFLSKPFLAD
jgi:DNA-3-methyladenine glycosylase